MPEIEFSRWETPFEHGDIQILETRFGNGGGYVGYPEEELLYEFVETNAQPWESLLIRLFHRESESIYRVLFPYIGAFRLLDEHGLAALWSQRIGSARSSTFKVRNHGWSIESDLAFFHYAKDGWSWMIATGNWCAEMLSWDGPDIQIEARVTSKIYPREEDYRETLSTDDKVDKVLDSILRDSTLTRVHGAKFEEPDGLEEYSKKPKSTH